MQIYLVFYGVPNQAGISVFFRFQCATQDVWSVSLSTYCCKTLIQSTRIKHRAPSRYKACKTSRERFAGLFSLLQNRSHPSFYISGQGLDSSRNLYRIECRVGRNSHRSLSKLFRSGGFPDSVKQNICYSDFQNIYPHGSARNRPIRFTGISSKTLSKS